MGRYFARVGLFALCATIACGGSRARHGTTVPSPGMQAAVEALPTRAEYSTGPTPDAIRGGALSEELARQVRAHFENLTLEGNGKLADVATRVAAETQRVGNPPGPAELDSIARDAGFAGPPPIVFVLPRTGEGWDHLEEYLAMSPGNIHFTHYGTVVLDLGGAVVGAVALGAENVRLEPVPRQVRESERVRVRGALAPGYAKGEVAWTRPDGSTRRSPAGGSVIDFESPPLERGIHRIEILGVGPSGLEVIANMPIASGVEIPKPAGPSEIIDESDPKSALLELVNRDRRRAGLRPLEGNATLDDVAEGHSKDMVSAHFFGHQSPTTGVVDDRLRAHGIRLGLFGENVAKGPTMADSHAMLLSSPAHRANVMNPRFTHVGLGVVEERSSDPRLFAVTEVFAGFPAPITDPEAVSGALFAELNRLRTSGKASPVDRAPLLDAAAREIGGAVSTSPQASPIEVAEPLLRKRIAGTRYRRPLLLIGFTPDPSELVQDVRLRGPNLRAAGIAVVQAPPGGIPMTNVVVFVVTE
jgi:Cysteine-rich secretory protein family